MSVIGLIARIEEEEGSDIWVEMGARLENVTGTPVVSATDNNSGLGIADLYTLDFSDVVVGVSATVVVSCAAPDNPYDQLTASVNLDGVTIYDSIVPGVDLVFSG